MLLEKKCKFIYLYTNALSSQPTLEPSTLSIVTSDRLTATLVQGQPVPATGPGFLKAALSKLSSFFTDAWSGVDSVVESPGPVMGPRMVSDRERKSVWEPSKRIITVDGKKVMLMAILWVTEEELLLAKKYPQVFGHDTSLH